MKLTVNEIFYSIQGEGGRQGEMSIFIRLTKCNLACSFCDTDFATGREMALDEILSEIKQFPCKWIIWTGGEPTIQLTDKHLEVFKSAGYKQAIETNGTRPVPSLIDYISCSPKVNYEKIKTVIPFAHEIRMPLAKGEVLPDIELLPKANNYFVSPIFDGYQLNKENIDYCIDLIKLNSKWRLSLQIHKLIGVE